MIGVDPSMQGRGLGRLLLDALGHVADRRAEAIYLETANPRNVVLYERAGYALQPAEPLMCGGDRLEAIFPMVRVSGGFGCP